jgi:anti-sigma regulatory factor (Ser/Thr protein kinase)
MAKLKIVLTNKLVEYYDVDRRLVLGRGKTADILLLDPAISREHSAVEKSGEEFVIADLGSANGTFVNDDQITEKVLSEGDIIRLGTKVIIFTREELTPEAELVVDLRTETLDSFGRDRIAGSNDVQFYIPSSEEEAENVYALSKELFRESSLSDDEADSLHTALREAIGNAIRHGNRNDPEKTVDFRCFRDEDKIICSVRDEGPGFDYKKALEKGKKGDAISAARERYMAGGLGGLGIMLMIRCVDLVEYNEQGNQIIITKCRGDFFRDETVIESVPIFPPSPSESP